MDLVWWLAGRLLAASDLLILLAAYWLVTDLAKRRAPAEGLAPGLVADAAFWLGAGAVVGARLVHVLPAWPVYLRYPLDIVRIQNGLSFYGAVAGTLAVAGWLAWRSRLPLGPLADLFAPYLGLGIAFERAGCVVRNDCFGSVAAPPLGVVFPGLSQPRYPAELYEAALALGLFAALLLWRERRRFRGELGLAFLVAYPLLRAAVGVTRINLGPWPTADQVVSVAVALTAAGIWLWRWSTLRRKPVEAGQPSRASRCATGSARAMTIARNALTLDDPLDDPEEHR